MYHCSVSEISLWNCYTKICELLSGQEEFLSLLFYDAQNVDIFNILNFYYIECI